MEPSWSQNTTSIGGPGTGILPAWEIGQTRPTTAAFSVQEEKWNRKVFESGMPYPIRNFPLTASMPPETEVFPHEIQPPVHIEPSARPFITDKVETALNYLLALLIRESRKDFVPVTKIEVTRYVDPEEDSQEVVVTEWVGLSPLLALEHWDKLCAAVETRMDYLPKAISEVIVSRLAIEVRWDSP